MIAAENNTTGSPEQPDPNTPETPDNGPNAQDGAPPAEERRPRRRGFAAMDRDRVKEIASKGGKAAHAAGTAHQFSSDEARNAGRKGGMAPHVRRGGVRRRPSEAAQNTSPTPAPSDQSADSRR
jgi:hypothetical protein